MIKIEVELDYDAHAKLVRNELIRMFQTCEWSRKDNKEHLKKLPGNQYLINQLKESKRNRKFLARTICYMSTSDELEEAGLGHLFHI
jgi:hypothetical protein